MAQAWKKRGRWGTGHPKETTRDPLLAAGAYLVAPSLQETRNQVANPTVPLPFPAEEVVRGLDAVIITHRHRDHLDARAEELLPRDVPVFCQPEDEQAADSMPGSKR